MLADEMIRISWFVWGVILFVFVAWLSRRFNLKIKFKFFENIALKLNKIMKPKPSNCWVLDVVGNWNEENKEVKSAFSKLEDIMIGDANPANFVSLFVTLLTHLHESSVSLQKGDKFMQCIFIDTDPELRLFQIGYCMGDDSINNPLYYSSRYDETAEITAKLFESFYLENNDYLHEARWKISE